MEVIICLVRTINPSKINLTEFSLGTFTYTFGDDINDRPIYRQSGGNAYFAMDTKTWVGSTSVISSPGDSNGLIFGQDNPNPKCPDAVSKWTVWSNRTLIYDPSFKFQCAVGK